MNGDQTVITPNRIIWPVYQNIIEFCPVRTQLIMTTLCKALHKILKIKDLTHYQSYDSDIAWPIKSAILQPKYSHLKRLVVNSKVIHLNHLHHLEYLKLYYAEVTNDDIQGITNLRSLDVYQCKNLTNINHLINLVKLKLRGGHKLNQSGINELTQLRILHIEDTPTKIDLSHFTNLTYLNISRYNGDNIDNDTLKPLVKLVTLATGPVENLTDINHLINLRYLDIGIECGLTNYGISKLVGLTTLTVKNTISDISTLVNLTDLDISTPFAEEFSNKSCKISDKMFTPGSFPSLTKLNVSGNPHVTNLNNLTNLSDLTIYGYGDGSDKGRGVQNDGIKDLINITRLSIQHNPNITDINTLVNITDLNIFDDICGVDDSGIRNLTKIKHINSDGNTKITKFNHMVDLEELCVDPDVGDDELTNLTNLVTLSMYKNKKITNLNHMRKLRCLYTHDTTIGDEGVTGLTNLRELIITNNKNITTIEHMTKLIRLEYNNEDLIDDVKFHPTLEKVTWVISSSDI
jgi:hypothetical protein